MTAPSNPGDGPARRPTPYTPPTLEQDLNVISQPLTAPATRQPTPLPKVLGLILLGFLATLIAGVALAVRFQSDGSPDAGLWVALPFVFLLAAFVAAALDSLRGWSRGRRLPPRFFFWSNLAVGVGVVTLTTVLERAGAGDGAVDVRLEFLAVVLGSVALAVVAWRNLDEAAREAHKWAWYWGGSVGIIPGFVLASFPGRSVQWASRLGYDAPGELIQFGAVTVLASMIVGYGLAWGAWWFGKR